MAEWFGFDQLDPAELDRLADAIAKDDNFLTNAVRKALDQGTALLVKELRRTRRSAAAANRQFRRGFEKRLWEHWRVALEAYDVFYQASVELGDELGHRFDEGAEDSEQDLIFNALRLLHGRACVVASEVQALLLSGHPSGAQARARTLHETAVVADVIAQGDADLAERYLLHRYISVQRDAEAYQKAAPTLSKSRGGYEPLEQAYLDDLQRITTELVARFGPAYSRDWGWAAPINNGKAPRFTDLEELVGLQHLRPFVLIAHHRVHATSRGAELNVLTRGPTRVMLAGPTNAGLADPAQSALISLGQCTAYLLLYGSRKMQDPMLVISTMALQDLLEEACNAFADAERLLAEKEAALWREDSDGQ